MRARAVAVASAPQVRAASASAAYSCSREAGALTCRNAAPYCAAPIRQRHLKQLLRTAALLPGPKVEIAPWNRLAQLGAVSPDSSATEAPSPAEPEESPREAAKLRALVGDCLSALARRLDEALPAALAR